MKQKIETGDYHFILAKPYTLSGKTINPTWEIMMREDMNGKGIWTGIGYAYCFTDDEVDTIGPAVTMEAPEGRWYKPMADILRQHNPSEQVVRRWLATRGCFMGGASGATQHAQLMIPDLNTERDIITLMERERLEAAFAEVLGVGVEFVQEALRVVEAAGPREAWSTQTHTSIQQLCKGVMPNERPCPLHPSSAPDPRCDNACFAQCANKARDYDAQKPTTTGVTKPDDDMAHAFPNFVTVGEGGSALRYTGRGSYYRPAGHWRVTARFNEEGKLICQGGKGVGHSRGKELIECTEEAFKNDNEGYLEDDV